MVPNPTRTKQKHVLLKAYSNLIQIEQAIEIANKNTAADIQISILGKTDFTHFGEDIKPFQKKEELKAYWKHTLGTETDFGFFFNPEIGTIFIAGSLTYMFIQDIDGKKLGAMTGGPYGILRGLGIEPDQSTEHIKILETGGYLLIIRGYDLDLKRLQDVLLQLDWVFDLFFISLFPKNIPS